MAVSAIRSTGDNLSRRVSGARRQLTQSTRNISKASRDAARTPLQKLGRTAEQKAFNKLARDLAKAAVPMAERHIILRFAIRFGVRGALHFIPGLNLLMLAWDAYDLWQLWNQLSSAAQYSQTVVCADQTFGPYVSVPSNFCTGNDSAVDPSVSSGWGVTNYNFGDGLKPALGAHFHSSNKKDGSPNPNLPNNNTGLDAGWRRVRRWGTETSPDPRSTTVSSPLPPEIPISWPEPVPVSPTAPVSPGTPQPLPEPGTEPSPVTPPAPSVSPGSWPGINDPLGPFPGKPPWLPIPIISPYPPPVVEPGSPLLPQPRPRPFPMPRPTTKPPWWPKSPDGQPDEGTGGWPVRTPGTGTAVVLRPDSKQQPGARHRFERPPKRTKEVKGRVYGNPGGPVVGLINEISEFRDAMQSVYDALPLKLRQRLFVENGRRSLTLLKMSKAVYQHVSEVDVGEAVKNLAKNEIEDRFFGKLSKLRNRAAYRNGDWVTGNVRDPTRRIGALTI